MVPIGRGHTLRVTTYRERKKSPICSFGAFASIWFKQKTQPKAPTQKELKTKAPTPKKFKTQVPTQKKFKTKDPTIYWLMHCLLLKACDMLSLLTSPCGKGSGAQLSRIACRCNASNDPGVGGAPPGARMVLATRTSPRACCSFVHDPPALKPKAITVTPLTSTETKSYTLVKSACDR